MVFLKQKTWDSQAHHKLYSNEKELLMDAFVPWLLKNELFEMLWNSAIEQYKQQNYRQWDVLSSNSSDSPWKHNQNWFRLL